MGDECETSDDTLEIVRFLSELQEMRAHKVVQSSLESPEEFRVGPLSDGDDHAAGFDELVRQDVINSQAILIGVP